MQRDPSNTKCFPTQGQLTAPEEGDPSPSRVLEATSHTPQAELAAGRQRPVQPRVFLEGSGLGSSLGLGLGSSLGLGLGSGLGSRLGLS